MTNNQILCVDDDQKILTGFERNLGCDYEISTALGPATALEIIEEQGPFAVVLSDMRMPEMNGVEFLARVRELSPNTVRMMLTGFADLNTTIAAVNQGHIFRFLSKPCEEDDIAAAFDAALKQYSLLEAEKELVEGTLRGSVKVLSEVLALVNPLAFGQSNRVQATVKGIVARFPVENAWQIEVAAMLSALGCVTLPIEVLKKQFAGEQLTIEEREMLSGHPVIAGELLRSIPRLDRVADIIAFQNVDLSKDVFNGRPVPLESRILKLATEFDSQELVSESSLHALTELRNTLDGYPSEMLDALDDFVKTDRKPKYDELKINEIIIGMVLAEDLKNHNGILLMSKGQKVTDSALRLLRNFSGQMSADRKIKVVVAQECEMATA